MPLRHSSTFYHSLMEISHRLIRLHSHGRIAFLTLTFRANKFSSLTYLSMASHLLNFTAITPPFDDKSIMAVWV
jgi:hypothetical protein